MSTQRTVLEVDLGPLAGRRFQPTGFPDLGAAEFDTANGGKALLVESAQSMANRLEATTWDEGRAEQAEALSALPGRCGLSRSPVRPSLRTTSLRVSMP